MDEKILHASIVNNKRKELIKMFYNLQIGESFVIRNNPKSSIIRVPGGWIFDKSSGVTGSSSCFIPFNNEFMESSDELD